MSACKELWLRVIYAQQQCSCLYIIQLIERNVTSMPRPPYQHWPHPRSTCARPRGHAPHPSVFTMATCCATSFRSDRQTSITRNNAMATDYCLGTRHVGPTPSAFSQQSRWQRRPIPQLVPKHFPRYPSGVPPPLWFLLPISGCLRAK